MFNRFGIQSVCVCLNVCLENDLNKSRIFIRSSICIHVYYVAFECADFVYFGDQANEFIMNVVSVAGFWSFLLLLLSLGHLMAPEIPVFFFLLSYFVVYFIDCVPRVCIDNILYKQTIAFKNLCFDYRSINFLFRFIPLYKFYFVCIIFLY